MPLSRPAKGINCMLWLPPLGELLNICADAEPTGGSAGK